MRGDKRKWDRPHRVREYICYKCHNRVKIDIDVGTQYFRCPYCQTSKDGTAASKIFYKPRPPVIKKISKIR